MQEDFESDSFDDGSAGGVVATLLKWGGAILSLGIVIILAIWAYNLGARDARDVPVVSAQAGPFRVEPEDPGGQVTPHQGNSINGVIEGALDNDGGTVTELAPPPEMPTADDAALAELETLPDQDPVFTPLRTVLDDDIQVDADQPPADEATPDTETAAEISEPENPGVDNGTATAPQTSLPPRGRPAGLDLAGRISPEQAAATSQTTERLSATEQVPPGTPMIQLGAFDSEELALLQWAAFVQAHSDQLQQRRLYVERITRGGQELYRVRALGFADRAQARAVCAALVNRGQPCFAVVAQ